MPIDTKSKSMKQDKKMVKKNDELLRKKKIVQSDSDSNESSESETEEVMDQAEYKKMLAKIFPSKYMNKKVKAEEKLKEAIKEDQSKKKSKIVNDSESEEETSESEPETKKNKKAKKGKKGKKSKVELSDSETDEMSEEYSDEEDPRLKYNIYTFGVNKDGESVCVRFEDYQPYLFAIVPEHLQKTFDEYKKKELEKYTWIDRLLKHRLFLRNTVKPPNAEIINLGKPYILK
jgi:cobalamin biosynthesis protein CobT